MFSIQQNITCKYKNFLPSLRREHHHFGCLMNTIRKKHKKTTPQSTYFVFKNNFVVTKHKFEPKKKFFLTDYRFK